LVKTFGKKLSSGFIDKIDPIEKMWMYHHWIQDQKDNIELAKNHAYLIGSFSNPEAVKKIIDNESNKNIHSSTDEEFENTIKIIDQPTQKRRRRKRKIE
jgi:hypothetical protein